MNVESPVNNIGNAYVATENSRIIKPDAAFFQINSDRNNTISVVSSRPVVDTGIDNKNISSQVGGNHTKIATDPFMAMTAKAYLIGNVETGKIIMEKNADEQMPVASMSKLVTAIVATDTMSPTTTITITPAEAAAPPDGSGISAGESYSLRELLYPMLLDSSNIAAEAIASSTDRVKFLENMSSYAWEIGMPQAYFADPSGVNPHNEASAKDIFTLAKYLYKFRPDILKLTRTRSTSVATTSEHAAHDFESIHPFVSDPRFIGGKTGRTPEAGETMLTILNIDGIPTAFVVMGSAYGAREGDTEILISAMEKQLVRS
ncbi:MAG: D-alanyl-D-alanine carboxypeptidase [Patescibacteria group bacterium]|nr:D-alanyl-D-alanine carboxypeptidase [Patescibacteria group bacterium]